MDRNASGFAYLKQNCSSISDAKIKEVIFVGPQIRELLQVGNFQNSLNEVKTAVWNSFRNIYKNFLGSVKVENYRDIVNDLLLSYKASACIYIWISFQRILVQLAMCMMRGFIKIYQAWRSGTKVNGVPVCLLTSARHSRGMYHKQSIEENPLSLLFNKISINPQPYVSVEIHVGVNRPPQACFHIRRIAHFGLAPATAFKSPKPLDAAQRKYSAYDRELLAVYLAIKHFMHLLEGRQFPVYTDHKPLTYAFQQNLDKALPRQCRHLDFIGQFTTDIRHIADCENVPADFLSRVEPISHHQPYDPKSLAEAQAVDQDLQALLTSENRSSLQLEKVQIPETNISLYCDVSTAKPRPFVPASCRRIFFSAYHNLSHPRVRATTRMVTAHYVWPAVKKDCIGSLERSYWRGSSVATTL
ncbi:hypothetical protein LAZ67_6003786 [Cordylochernes scorpioides]|uniref:Reverse transcriptase RNase H-like domain-containing protein n=1 Tax=Cordylochernes scorpioides TaxID=51811 RepID=A0ABY6KKW6_9ARAC|nr:hypothetical protein LAZ67_6003786 [Cordylochernes scorpioides]